MTTVTLRIMKRVGDKLSVNWFLNHQLAGTLMMHIGEYQIIGAALGLAATRDCKGHIEVKTEGEEQFLNRPPRTEER